jgi:hypothetical protein
MGKKRVFVDTNAIFPAIQVGEWRRLCGHFSVETVETVIGETQNGDVNRPGYVSVDRAVLEQTLTKIHRPDSKDRAALQLKLMELKSALDDGERDLLAYLLGHEKPSENVLVLTTSDRAAVLVCCHLGWADALVSLDRLLKDAGAPSAALKALAPQQRESWLSGVRTSFRLRLIP